MTRSINLGFAYLLAMIVLPAALLLSVDHRKGMLDVRNAAPAAGTALLHYCITTSTNTCLMFATPPPQLVLHYCITTSTTTYIVV